MDMQDIQFPATLPAQPLKRWIKVLIGRIAERFDPAYAKQIAAGQLPARLGSRERLLLAALVDRHQRTGTLGALASLHAWLWQGDQAVAFHAQARDRFDAWWLQIHSAIVEPIRARIDAGGTDYRQLCEIGCGSGLVLEDLARRLPQLHTLIGLDLSPKQTEHNRQRPVDPRIRFEAGDASQWIPQHGQPGTVFMTVAGVFEYFPRESLQALFATIARRCTPAIVAVIEPMPKGYDFERETASRPYGPEHSLGHHYPLLLREAGFSIVHQQLRQVEGADHLLLVAEIR